MQALSGFNVSSSLVRLANSCLQEWAPGCTGGTCESHASGFAESSDNWHAEQQHSKGTKGKKEQAQMSWAQGHAAQQTLPPAQCCWLCPCWHSYTPLWLVQLQKQSLKGKFLLLPPFQLKLVLDNHTPSRTSENFLLQSTSSRGCL